MKIKLFEDERITLGILIILSSFLFLFGIGSIPILDGDTAFYAKIAKNIISSGDWLTMTFTGTGEIINKPPLVMWLMAVSYKLFGITEFAVSFWHSLLAIGTVILTYFIGKELFDRKTAFISSLILLTSAQFFYQARSPLQDMPLTFFITASFYAFILYYKKGKLLYFYLAPIFVALATLTKGPVGFAIPALIFFGIMLLAKKPLFPKIRDYFIHLPFAILLFAVIAMPWFIAEYFVLGKKFVDVFWSSNFGRYLSPIDKVPGVVTIAPQYDFYSYFLQILLLAAPWSGFIYPALYLAFRKKEENTNFLLIFAAAVVLFFSFSLNYKVSRYILPAYPALSIIVGSLWKESLDGEEKTNKPMLFSLITTLAVVVPSLILLMTWLIYKFPAEQAGYMPIVLPFLIILIAGMSISSIFFFFRRAKISLASFAISAIISYFVLIQLMDIYFKEACPYREFCNKINRMATPKDVVIKYKGYDAHLMIYYSEYPVDVIKNEEKLKVALTQKKKAYVITDDKKAFDEFKTKHPKLVTVLDEKNNFVLFTN
ncbi:MAG: glycosyltransferase family 39 protein [Candidatus Saganbacteria bacterium]|nr:glycosyltransferase family 39 protein [Candidatus Saganbacteria bacterium]